MPCLSSGFAAVKPGASLGMTNHDGPSGVIASTVSMSAIDPLEIHCLRPLIR